MQSLARCLIAAAFAFAFAPFASAQAWPAKPIRLIVSLPPGTVPDVVARIYAPGLGEALGQPDVNTSIVNGVFAPAGTPREIVTRLNREIGRIMQTAESRAAIAAISAELVTASPEEFATMMRRDRERFGAMVRGVNIRVD